MHVCKRSWRASDTFSMQLTFTRLTSLVYAFKHFPEYTPKRWELVSQFVRRCEGDSSDTDPFVTIGNGGTMTTFEATAHCCRLACRILVEKHPHLLSYAQEQASILFADKDRTPFKPIVLLPGRTQCCGRKIIIRYGLLANNEIGTEAYHLHHAHAYSIHAGIVPRTQLSIPTQVPTLQQPSADHAQYAATVTTLAILTPLLAHNTSTLSLKSLQRTS